MWRTAVKIRLRDSLDENGGKCRIQVVDGEKGEVFELDFSDFSMPVILSRVKKKFVRQQIRYAQIKIISFICPSAISPCR